MQPSNRPFLIAITGGIATGKSIAVAVFRSRNIPVWETDTIAHEILQEKQVIKKITTHFGNDILQNGKIQRPKLGKLIFADETKRNVLNSIVHPFVLKKMQSIADSCKETYLAFEIPLLFELQLEACFDLNIHIYCSHKLQMQRLQERNNLDKSEARKRIQSQMDTSEKMQKADVNIANNQSVYELQQNVLQVIHKLPAYSFRDVKPLYKE